MQVTETLSDGLKRELKVTIPAGELDGRLTNKLNDLKDKVRIAGFRPGKVPVAHLRRVYGRSVMAEIVQEAVNETSQKALKEREERPAFQPNISFTEDAKEIESVLAGKADLDFSMAFEIMPKFEAADFSKISVTKQVAEIPAEEIEQAVQRIAENNRPFNARGDGAAAENGDRITMSFEGFVDGTAFEGGSDDNAMLVLGSNSYIPGFEEQLVGAKAGDDLTVNVKFPDEYQAEHLKGKDAEFKVHVKEVAAPGEVAIDDAFAATLGLESVEKLRDAIREQMSSEISQVSRRKLKRALLDALDEAHSFELPPTLVEQEFNSIWQQLEQDMKQSGRSFEDEGSSEEEARAEYSKIAERRVRLGLLLAEVGDKNEIKVTDEEVNRALMEQIRQFPGQEQMVYDFYRKNPQALAQLRAPIYEDKVVDYILALAQVKEEKVSREELMKDAEDENDHAHHDHSHHGHDHAHHDHDHHDHDHGHDHKHD